MPESVLGAKVVADWPTYGLMIGANVSGSEQIREWGDFASLAA